MDPEAQGGFDTRGLMMLYTDPPKHTRYRRLVSKGFTPRMIGMIEQYLRNRSRLIVDNVIERGECDFVVDLASELPLQAIAEIMGVPQEDRRLIFEWSNAMIGADDPEFEGGAEGAHEASAALYAYANDLAKQRRSDPRDDIVTKLINAEIDGEQLSELEFDMFMLLLAVAGNETTRNTTAWGMWALMQHPEQYAHLRDNLDTALSPAIEEILRWASPVYHFRRTTTAATELHGPRDRRGRQGRDVVHLGQPRRDRVRRPVPLRHHARAVGAGRVRRRRPPLLPGRQPRPHGAAPHLRGGAVAHPRHAPRRRPRGAALQLHRRRQAHAGGVHPGARGSVPDRPPDMRVAERAR